MGLKRKDLGYICIFGALFKLHMLYEGTLENTGNHEYCMAVPSTYVQDCDNLRVSSQLFS